MLIKPIISFLMLVLLLVAVLVLYPGPVKPAPLTVDYTGIEVEIPEFTVRHNIPVPEAHVKVLEVSRVINVNRISAYNPVPRQTQGNPNVSSCGPNLERQIAVSRDIFFDSQGRKHLCGTRVTVVTDRGEVFTDYVIWDTMNPRFRNTVDIMLPHTNEAEAFAFGVTTGVVYLYID